MVTLSHRTTRYPSEGRHDRRLRVSAACIRDAVRILQPEKDVKGRTNAKPVEVSILRTSVMDAQMEYRERSLLALGS